MNRYGRGPSSIGAPSKATTTTLCQRCLKRDIYECKSNTRPYISRPSRTQQLLNPKLLPTLSNEVPQDLLRKKGVADEQLAKAEMERGRKRSLQSEDPEILTKRMRSASPASVSTISTNLSRSRSPPRRSREPDRRKFRPMSLSKSPHRGLSSSPPPSKKLPDSEKKKRRRESQSSGESHSSTEMRAHRERGSSRSTRRRYQQASPPIRGRRPTESRSPVRERRRLSNDRQRDSFGATPNIGGPPKERSLSPFSKRLALTQAMNMGR